MILNEKTMKKSFLILLVIGVLFACIKKQPEINGGDNACDCLGEVSADFKIGQYWKDEFVPLDTIHMYMKYEPGYPSTLNTNCYVNFRAKDQNAKSYEWQIGNNGSVFSTSNVGLYFSDTVGTIDVRLIVKSTPRTDCFPNDDGIDTTYRKICIKSLPKPPLTGTYWGYLKSNPTHFFNVYIDTFTSPSNNTYIKYGIKNLPEGNLFDSFGFRNTMSFEGVSEAHGNPGTYYRFESNKTNGILRYNNELRVQFSAKKLSDDGNWTVLQYFDNDEFIGIKQ